MMYNLLVEERRYVVISFLIFFIVDFQSTILSAGSWPLQSSSTTLIHLPDKVK
jgi:hypothetical protein